VVIVDKQAKAFGRIKARDDSDEDMDYSASENGSQAVDDSVEEYTEDEEISLPRKYRRLSKKCN
jgi:hypothetical protein